MQRSKNSSPPLSNAPSLHALKPALRPHSAFTSVELYVYDLSKGLCRVLSPFIFGQSVAQIIHTSVVVHNREYFFSSRGIIACVPGTSVLGVPDSIVAYGVHPVQHQDVKDWIAQGRVTTFAPSNYSLLDFNCVTFTEFFLFHFIRADIPDFIKYQVRNIANTPLGNTWIKVLRSRSRSNVSIHLGSHLSS